MPRSSDTTVHPLWYVFFFALITGLIGFLIWITNPGPAEKFQVQGEFVSAEYAFNDYVLGNSDISTVRPLWDYTRFSIRIDEAEKAHVEREYSGRGNHTLGPVKTDSGYLYGHVARGNWCGPLPLARTKVLINSPTGFVRDVVIYDTATNQTYRSLPDCKEGDK